MINVFKASIILFFTWNREHQLLIDIAHRHKIIRPLLDILLVQRALVLENIQIRHRDGKDFAKGGQPPALQPRQQLRQPRNNAKIERAALRHENVLNNQAGLGVQRRMVEQMEAEDENLVRFSEKFRGVCVQKAEGAEHLQTQLFELDFGVGDWQRVAEDVPAAGQQVCQHGLHSALLHKSMEKIIY